MVFEVYVHNINMNRIYFANFTHMYLKVLIVAIYIFQTIYQCSWWYIMMNIF